MVKKKETPEQGPAPMKPPPTIARLVETWADKPEISGVASGTVTSRLVDQVAQALFYGSTPTQELLDWKQWAAVNTMKAMAPQDAIEGQLVAQMVATHDAAMECFRRAALPEQTFEGRQSSLGFANKLLRTYALLTDTLNKHRGKGQQTVRVEHVTVEAGGQAIVGNVTTGGGGEGRIGHQPHATLADAGLPSVRGEDAERISVPSTCSER
ncbi:hypothetical protein [Geminicoccus harenae]|uniref:hypothetical protein n=1 Tax=Geminicoccus harenae TaxID=2498453 RepID=UPI00168A6BBB|nr:hypothetical protein [Geminicoccus harenae]